MWIAPTPESVLASLPKSEVELYKSFEDDSEDLLPGIIARATALIRSRVAACSEHVMDPDATRIPPECEDALLAIVRHRLLARLDAEEPSPDDRRTREYRDAMAYLDQLAACKATITPGASTPSGGIALVSSRERIARRKNLEGLL